MPKTPVKSLDQQEAEITSAIGNAIAAWSRVEEELSLVFIAAMGTETPRVPRAAFYAILSFEGKLKITSAAVEAIWPPLSTDDKAEWDSLNVLLGRKGKSRNEIAHCGLIRDHGRMAVYADPFCRMVSNEWATRDHFLSAKQIREKGNGFMHAAARVALFEERLAARLGRRSGSLLLANNPGLRSQVEGDPNRAKPPNPPKPSQT